MLWKIKHDYFNSNKWFTILQEMFEVVLKKYEKVLTLDSLYCNRIIIKYIKTIKKLENNNFAIGGLCCFNNVKRYWQYWYHLVERCEDIQNQLQNKVQKPLYPFWKTKNIFDAFRYKLKCFEQKRLEI